MPRMEDVADLPPLEGETGAAAPEDEVGFLRHEVLIFGKLRVGSNVGRTGADQREDSRWRVGRFTTRHGPRIDPRIRTPR